MSQKDSLSPVQFVSLGETIADIALKEKQSAGITATASILLALLVMAAFVSNALLLATILSRYFILACFIEFWYTIEEQPD